LRIISVLTSAWARAGRVNLIWVFWPGKNNENLQVKCVASMLRNGLRIEVRFKESEIECVPICTVSLFLKEQRPQLLVGGSIINSHLSIYPRSCELLAMRVKASRPS
jgi:hypothetical protein